MKRTHFSHVFIKFTAIFLTVSLFVPLWRIETGSLSRHACLNDTTILKSPLDPPKSILSSSMILHTSGVQRETHAVPVHRGIRRGESSLGVIFSDAREA